MTLSSISFLIVLFVLQLKLPLISSYDRTITCGCSDKSQLQSKIIGGQTVRTRTWSWAVSIRVQNRFQCAGSILTSSWILTAAHCFSFTNSLGVNTIRIDPSLITVHAGSNNRLEDNQYRRAIDIFSHSQFDPLTYLNDIALIKVSTPFDMTDITLGQICLPNSSSNDYPLTNTSLVAIGWGRLWQNGPESLTLQQVILKAIAAKQSSCSPLVTDSSKQLCAGVENSRKDTCQGDSGGPLMLFTASQQWVIVGLTSFGYGCAIPQYSGVYTRISAYVDWIKQFINMTDTSLFPNSSVAFNLYNDGDLEWIFNRSFHCCISLHLLIFLWMILML
ncbi:unnamed protein product [Adineta ricciae]|uniref:Peptidase S1 domain-containing protein n=1 Tax=Adineta ricciae TaxID=249248 RepID=A0A814DU87_ADIRI|nr:unnamed protein product [Adineta ricciae]CAF1424855.1 unnamed protein product [Adineta ricciae]